MNSPIEFKKSALQSIIDGKIPMWSGCEIDEIDFHSMNLGGKLDIKLESGSNVNVDMDEIKFI